MAILEFPDVTGLLGLAQREPARPEINAIPAAEKVAPTQRVKGHPIPVFQARQTNGLSDVAVDCRECNRVNLHIVVSGSSPSATISVEGAMEEAGTFIQLNDSTASRMSITANDNYDVTVGTPWVRVRIASISGTFGAGEGYTIFVTPWVD